MTERPSLGLLGSSVELIDQGGRRIGERRMLVADGELREALKTRNPFCHSAIIMRRDAYERAGGYRPGLRICEDFDLWCRMSEVTELANIERPLVRYRIHGTAMSIRQPIRMMIVDQCIVAAGHARRRGLPEPFANGAPQLRRALDILNIERSTFLYELLKVIVVAGRLALQSNDRAEVMRLRRLAYGVLFTMPQRAAIQRGLWRMLGIYSRPYSRHRRRAFFRRMFSWNSEV